jgi:hypothetical protein
MRGIYIEGPTAGSSYGVLKCRILKDASVYASGIFLKRGFIGRLGRPSL